MSEFLRYEMPEYLAQRQAARRVQRRVQVGAVLLAVGCFVGAGFLVKPMNYLRTEHQLVIDPDTVKGLPPTETILARIGTLRALAIDIAFMRLERLKEEDKFFEAMQLASWICKMAPQFPSVWSYHAWNQAYNISVACYSPEERWHWVNNGIKLLRDEGIVYNPKSVSLYKELAYIYWHKIGDFMDDEHWNYKKELALEMELVLGPPPLTVSGEESIELFRKIVDAPRDVDKMIAEDEGVAAFVDELATVELKPDETLLHFVAKEVRDRLAIKRYLKSRGQFDERTLRDKRIAVLTDEKFNDARERLLAALRSKALRENYKFNLEWMLKLMEDYGPIDWRGPYAMSLYWASWGDYFTSGQLNLDENASMNTARFIVFSLDNMVKRGKIFFEPNFERPTASQIDYLPDTRFIDYHHEAMLKISKAQFGNHPDYVEGEPAANYRTGHFGFLAYAVRLLYLDGTKQSHERARYYYDYLRRVNREEWDGSMKQIYNMPLREFVLADLLEQGQSFRNSMGYIAGMLISSFNQLALGNMAESQEIAAMAKEVYDYYMKDMIDDRIDRRQLEKFIYIRADAVKGYMTNALFPVYYKMRVWESLDLVTRQMVWDELEGYFTEICEKHDPPIDRAKAFAEPAGMELYRLNPVDRRQREFTEQDFSSGEKS